MVSHFNWHLNCVSHRKHQRSARKEITIRICFSASFRSCFIVIAYTFPPWWIHVMNIYDSFDKNSCLSKNNFWHECTNWSDFIVCGYEELIKRRTLLYLAFAHEIYFRSKSRKTIPHVYWHISTATTSVVWCETNLSCTRKSVWIFQFTTLNIFRFTTCEHARKTMHRHFRDQRVQ